MSTAGINLTPGYAGSACDNVLPEAIEDLYITEVIIDWLMTKPYNSAPENLHIKIVGVALELEASVQEFLVTLLDKVGQKMGLSGLDGITFASDYHQALLDLDRGYDTNYKLTPSNDHGAGIAMSPSVMRKNKLKTHIVISAQSFFAMLKDGRDSVLGNARSLRD